MIKTLSTSLKRFVQSGFRIKDISLVYIKSNENTVLKMGQQGSCKCRMEYYVSTLH